MNTTEKRLFEKYSMDSVLDILNTEVKNLHKDLSKDGKPISNGILRWGNDYASKVYVKNKINKCKEFGIETNFMTFSDEVEGVLYKNPEIDILNRKALFEVNKVPYLIQLPIDTKLLSKETINKIIDVPANLDIDGMNFENIGKLITKDPDIIPCTVRGVLSIMEDKFKTKDFRNLKVCVFGRSHIVGFPLMMRLISMNAQVSHINSTHDIDLLEAAKNNKYPFNDVDVIILAVGKHGIFDSKIAEQIIKTTKKDLFIIDVGINRDENNKLTGDFKIYEEDIDKETLDNQVIYTPVPGGVGKLTVMGVVLNTLILHKLNNKRR